MKRNSWAYHALAALAIFVLAVNGVSAEPYPDHPIRVIVPFAPRV